MSNFQNLGCLIETQKKSTQTIFQGGSPWAALVFLVFNNMFVVVVFFALILSKSFSPFLCYIFCLLLSWILLASSPWFLWCFYDISIKFLWEFYGISLVFLWHSMVFLKGRLWNFYAIPMGFQKELSIIFLYGISTVVPWYFYGISIGPLWDFHGITMGFLKWCRWYFYGIPMGFNMVSMEFRLDSYGISIGCLWDFSGISVGFPRNVYWISMIFLWYY